MSEKAQKILMIGCGKMGGALLRQWVKLKGLEFSVVDPFVTTVPAQTHLYRSQSELPNTKFAVIIIAVKPQLIEDVVPVYHDRISDSGCIISIAAGFAIRSIEAIWPDKAVIRVMPNLPALIGKGVCGLVSNEHTQTDHIKLIERLTNAVGETIRVNNEDKLDRLTAISGSGPGYIFEFCRIYIEAAKSLGFTDQEARSLVLHTIHGTAEMALLQEGESLGDLRKSVTSKKGTTEAGLEAFNGDAMLTTRIKETLEAAYRRALELR